MADDFGLIGDAERAHVLDELRRRADVGVIGSADLSELTARVHAAQTHAGLESILRELPAEQPWRMPTALPSTMRPRLPWWQRPAAVLAAAAVVGTSVFIAAIVLIGAEDREPSATGRTIIELPPAEVPTATTRSSVVETQPPTTAPPTTTSTVLRPLEPSFEDAPAQMLLIGRDIEPGRYKSTSMFCYWERRAGTEPGLDHVIVNGGTYGGPAVVDISASDVAFSSDDCDWKPYAPAEVAATTMGDGDWLVGSDIAPGAYQRTSPDGSFGTMCWWERASGFSHDFDEVIDWGTPAGAATVTLRSGERFTSETCDTWTKTG